MNNTPTVHATVSKILVPVLGIEYVMGIIGNGIALIIFCFNRNFWKSSTMYLLSLVVADFFLITSLPFRMHYYTRNEVWTFSKRFCQVNLFMLSMNRTASIVFLTVIAVDRYFKVVHPHHQLSKLSIPCAAKIAALIWILCILLNIHIFTLHVVQDNTTCRGYDHPKADISLVDHWHRMLIFIEFFISLGIIFFCIFRVLFKLKQKEMARGKRIQRTMKLLIIIVLVYSVCFSPVILFALAVLIVWKVSPQSLSYKVMNQLFHASFAFTYLNSALDPVLYCFSSVTLQNRFKKMFCPSGCFEDPMKDNNNESSARILEQRGQTFNLPETTEIKQACALSTQPVLDQ